MVFVFKVKDVKKKEKKTKKIKQVYILIHYEQRDFFCNFFSPSF